MARKNTSIARTEDINISLKGDLPRPTIRRLPIESLSEQVDNVREEINLVDANGLMLFRSMSVNGQLPGHFITVNERHDGTIVVLIGNRRVRTAKVLRNKDALNATFSGLDGKRRNGITAVEDGRLDEIECLVYEGLTTSQESQIRADHAGTAPLAAWDKYVQVIQLWEAGLTSLMIESQTGFSHGTAERYRYLYEMDPVVEKDFYDRCHGKKHLNLKQVDINELHKLWNADKDAGITIPIARREHKSNLANAGSSVFKKFGPLSQAKWDELVARAAAAESGEPTPEDSRVRRSQKQHEDNADRYKDAPFTSAYAKWAAGDPTVDLNALYTAEKAFLAEHKRLRLDYENLVERNLELQMENERLTDELARLTTPALPAPIEAIEAEVISD